MTTWPLHSAGARGACASPRPARRRCSPSSAAAIAGLLGFLGLVDPAPRAARRRHRLAPLRDSGQRACGAALLLAADTLARVVLAPIELPVGPLMVVLGVPLFLWLLREAV